MKPLEVNEVLALAFVLVAYGATLVARGQPSNTPRTRAWWGRFLVMLSFLLVAELATNLEQYFADGTTARDALNILEHAFLAGTGAWALVISILGLMEAYARGTAREGKGP